MRWRGWLGVVSTLTLLAPAFAFVFANASALPPVFITEVQTANQTASQEFIELYNNTDADINLASETQTWKIEYFSSTKVAGSDFNWEATDPTGTFDLNGVIAAHSYYLISSNSDDQPYKPGNIEPEQTYNGAHLANTGGGLQLVTIEGDTTNRQDRVGWYESGSAPSGFYSTPPAGGSLQRMVNEAGNYNNENSDPTSFASSQGITPKAPWSADQEPTLGSPPPDPGHSPDDLVTLPARPLQITELLPNPAAPASDANDEFVEIYNPNGEDIDLEGYTVQAGLTYGYSYELSDITIPGYGYIVLTSGDTSLTLANSGGQARLLDPNGKVMSTTDAYSDAPDGQAWAMIDGRWQWTTTPTPAEANKLTIITVTPKAVAKKVTPKTSTKKKATAKMPTTKASKGSVLGTSDEKRGPANEAPASIHPGVLAGIGVGAVLYGAYEYRGDLANKLYQLRRYRSTRRAARQKA